jgi:hypothetical protein
MENEFVKMNINLNNMVQRWRQEKRLVSVKFCELKNLQKGDYFIRLSQPNHLCQIIQPGANYVKYTDWLTYTDEPTTFTTQKVELLKFSGV